MVHKYKILFSFIFISQAFSNEGAYQSKRFGPSLGVDPNTLLMSGYVKGEESGFSKLAFYDLNSQKVTAVALPKKYENRSVVALASHQNPEKFYIVTQWQRGDLDDPQLHLWDSKTNTWEDLGSLHCKVFDSYVVTKGELKLNCQSEAEIDKKGKVKIETKSFSAKDIKEVSATSFPYGKIQISGALENELKIKIKKVPAPVTLEASKIF